MSQKRKYYSFSSMNVRTTVDAWKGSKEKQRIIHCTQSNVQPSITLVLTLPTNYFELELGAKAASSFETWSTRDDDSPA